MNRLLGGFVLGLVLLAGAHAQVIEFESNGQKYQTLTRSGVTVMWAQLPTQLHGYVICQFAISNGSCVFYFIRPEDFHYLRHDGTVVNASPFRDIVNLHTQK